MKTKSTLSFFYLLVATFLFSCNKADRLTVPVRTSEDLTNVLQAIYNDTEVPGFAVSVVKQDGILYQNAFGKADIRGRKPYLNQTTQPIGSISKTFVASAVVKAIEQGYFTLETDINDILPFEVKNPKQPNAIIRVKHLVTHTSGLVDNAAVYRNAYHILRGESLTTKGAELFLNLFMIQQRVSVPLKQFLEAYYLEGGANYSVDNFTSTTPGSAWNYSNIATSLTAYLVEFATGMPFKEYVQRYIFQPLQMYHTAYDVTALNPDNRAKLYWDSNTPLPLYANDSYPDGSINTCNEDLAKYLKEMIKGANGESELLFSKDGYQLLFNALLSGGKTPSNIGENQGIFWLLEGDKIKHSGSDPGTTCNIQFSTEKDAGYLLLTNMDASVDVHASVYFDFSEKVQNAINEFINHN